MRRTMVGAVILAALGILVIAAPVAAFPLTNCTLGANGLAADGSTIDSVKSGAADATQDAPFLVDWDGTVTYDGTSQIELKNNSWHVDVFGIPTTLQGGDANTADTRDGNGTVSVSDNAPFKFTGLYFVSGSITGSGGTCTGSGWLKLTGDPTGTIPMLIALLVLLLGLAMLVYGAMGHAITAVVGGFLSGLGLAALLIQYSTLPLGSLTPLAIILIGLVVGVLVAILGRRMGRGSDTAPMLPPTNAPAPPPGAPTST
jgi:hypothetical protein